MHVLAQWDVKAVEEKMYPTSRYGDGGFGGTHPDIDPADWGDGS
ncbi:hypothetical protein [Limimaricola soesokkakensis]|nr:hypothetical protein [Limimaricola soesokkakensis]